MTYVKTICDVDESGQDDISSEKSFRQNNASHCGVVKSALKPLVGVCMRCILR